MDKMRNAYSYCWRILRGIHGRGQGRRFLHGTAFIPFAAGYNDPQNLVQQYLTEKAEASAPQALERAFDQHMTFYLAYLAANTTALRLTLGAAPLQCLQAEWPQIESAWWRAVESGNMALLDQCMDIVMYFEATGTWQQGLHFLEQTRVRLPAKAIHVQARLEASMSILALQLYDLREAKRLADRALVVLDKQTGVDAHTAVYAHLSRAIYDYLIGGATTYASFLATMIELTTTYFGLFGHVIQHMLDGARLCRYGAYQSAVDSFQEIIKRLGSGSYALPSIRCMLGLSYLRLEEPMHAAEQFQLALRQGRKLGVLPAQVSATYELQEMGLLPETANASEALAELANQYGATEAVGHVALHVGVHYLNFGHDKGAKALFRIGLGMLWPHLSKAEFARASFTVGKFLLLAKGASWVEARRVVDDKAHDELYATKSRT